MVTLIALFGTALLFGTSAFGFLMTPLIFRGLADAGAAAYLRQLFPVYYLILTVAGAVTAVAFALDGHPIRVVTMALVTAFALIMRQIAIPHVVKLHLRVSRGDSSAERRYVVLRRVAVTTTFVQMVATGTILSWFLA